MESHALITYRERGYIDIKVNICTAFPIQNHQIPLCLGSILPIQHLDNSKVKLHQRVNSVSVNSYRIRVKKHEMSVWKNTWKHIRLIQVRCMRVWVGTGYIRVFVCEMTNKYHIYVLYFKVILLMESEVFSISELYDSMVDTMKMVLSYTCWLACKFAQ